MLHQADFFTFFKVEFKFNGYCLGSRLRFAENETGLCIKILQVSIGETVAA